MDEISALKKEVLDLLRGDTAIATITGERIYDVPPVQVEALKSPYIRFGPWFSSEAEADCFESYDITAQIDVYSWGEGEAASTMQANKLAGAITALVNGIGEDIEKDLGDGFTLTYIRVRSKRSLTASDGTTKHTPITVSAVVDKS